MTALVVGLGNRDRGDDAVGLLVLDRLGGRVGPSVRLRPWPGDPMGLLDLAEWRTADALVLVDAVISGVPEGTIHRIDVTEEPLPVGCGQMSSHGMGVAMIVELARAFGTLPARAVVVGVEVGAFGHGQAPRRPVADAVEKAVDVVLDELARLAPSPAL